MKEPNVKRDSAEVVAEWLAKGIDVCLLAIGGLYARVVGDLPWGAPWGFKDKDSTKEDAYQEYGKDEIKFLRRQNKGLKERITSLAVKQGQDRHKLNETTKE